MKIIIRHELKLSVPDGAPRAVEHLLLTPLSGPSQTVKDWAIEVPGIETAARFIDAYGNRALLVGQTRPGPEIDIVVSGAVETTDRNGVIGRVPGDPVVALYKRVTPLTEPDPRMLDPFRNADRYGSARIALFHAVMDRAAELYRFGAGEAAEPAKMVLDAVGVATQAQNGQTQAQKQSQGDAQDDDRQEADAPVFAHAFIGVLRALDIPVRYVTGYLAAGDDRPAAFHAWAEAWDDSLGWIAFDPALGICPTDRHVRVATGLDAPSTLPVRLVPATGEPVLVGIEAVASAQ
ncbi:MAG: transglutaminase family protein [Devosia sp.]|nr:transglutaminase family protein [Devosia sp.]